MWWLQKEEKLALDAAIRTSGKAATELVVHRALPSEHTFPVTATHFGGNPYLEAGDAWPTIAESGQPYDFVCQVNLNDCPQRPDVPFDLFTVFLCWAIVEGEEGDLERDIDRTCIVRTYASASAAKAVPVVRPRPRSVKDYRVRPCAVRTKPFMTYPTGTYERIPAITAAAAKFRNPDAAVAASFKRLGALHDFRSRVGGFPRWVHENTFDDDDLVFLAQIDYETEANNCIGDAAPLYIAVSKSDPTRIKTDAFQSF